MDPNRPHPYLGPCSPEHLRERATFAQKTARMFPTPFTLLQAWLASQAALYCEAPADLVLP